MILIDLQKAFGTMNHEILGKLHAIGFSEKTVAWFKLYLSDRAFKVNINNHFSDLSKISCGVLQGSILGPLLFFTIMLMICLRPFVPICLCIQTIPV